MARPDTTRAAIELALRSPTTVVRSRATSPRSGMIVIPMGVRQASEPRHGDAQLDRRLSPPLTKHSLLETSASRHCKSSEVSLDVCADSRLVLGQRWRPDQVDLVRRSPPFVSEPASHA